MLRADDAGAGVVDLADAATVFVTTVGAPTVDACMARLSEQDCRFTEEDFFALMGTIAGVLSSRQGIAPAKDFRTYDRLPGYAALQAFLAAFPAAPPVEETEASGIGSAPPRRRS
ncbi:MAG TPA: hypothetical protein VL049_25365 [Candidatus Dormibacteraeota bacterium]|nr:hypothetical protein [Candidatus Dormibacteraeota bacterium]